MLKKLLTPEKEEICPNCGTACLVTDIFCPNCKVNLDELFEQLPEQELRIKSFINIPEAYKPPLKWTLATTIGFVLGEVFLTPLTFRFIPLSLIEINFGWFEIMLHVAAGIATGLSIGVCQWVILKNYFTHNWLWVLATVFGVTCGNLTEILVFVVVRGSELPDILPGYSVIVPLAALFVAGLEIGLIQSVVLHKFLSKTWTWAIATGLSWALAVTVGTEVIRPMFYPVVDYAFIEYAITPFGEIIIYGTSGVLFGATMGIQLLWLFKQNHIMIQTAA